MLPIQLVVGVTVIVGVFIMPSNVYKCNNCVYESKSISKFLSHCKFHKNQPHVVFDCPFEGCLQNFRVFASMKVHISRAHKVEPQHLSVTVEFNQNISQKCSRGECVALSFESFIELKKHLKQHLKKREDIHCPFNGCSHRFNVSSSFTSHLSRKHKVSNEICVPFASASEYNVVTMETDTLTVSQDNSEIDIGINDFEYDESEANETNFLYKLAMFYLKLQGKYLLPSSTIQALIEEFEECHDISQFFLNNKICKKLELLGVSAEIISQVRNEIDHNDLFANCNKGPLKTPAKRSSFFHKNFAYCDPVEVFVGLDGFQKKRTYQYVPICQSIASLYRHFSSHFNFFNGITDSEKKDFIDDVDDGSVFKANGLFKHTKSFAIILYQDAFEVVNPLGSAKRKHKMVGVYYTLANFDVEKRSNIDHMQLVLLCLEKDLKAFSANTIFARLVHDLKVLEEDGISFNDEIIKGTLLCICGDNLGSHMVGGFNESFSSHFFCRYCEIDRTDSPMNVRSSQRTVESYRDVIDSLGNNDSVKGIKSDSPFNALRFYHVLSPGLPPCLGHDLFEGVVSYDMVLIVKYLIGIGWFTCEQLNYRIEKWTYAAVDKLDKPAPFTEGSEKLSGHAVQNWVFLRLFSLLIGNFVNDPLDKVWQMYLNLKTIVEILTSTSVTLAQIAFVNVCIEEYLFDRQTLFPGRPLRPKHHFLLHYPELSLAFGPLIHLWTMRFESKHTYFKTCARQLQNFKHLSKTLANRHQMLQAYYTSGSLFQRRFIYEKTHVLCKSIYNEEIQQIIEAHNLSESNTMVCASAVFRNVQYKVGYWVIISGEQGCEHILGKIQLILVSDGGLLFILSESTFNFVYKLGVYEQKSDLIKYSCVSVSKLKSCFPVPVYKIRNSVFLSLKSLQ